MSGHVFKKSFFLVSILLATALVVCLMANVENWHQQEIKLDSGSTFFEIDGNAVIALSYKTNGFTLIAQRSKKNKHFELKITYSDDRKSTQCVAPEVFEKSLENFFVVKVKHQVDDFDKAHPISLGIIEIKDIIASEPLSRWEFFASDNPYGVVMKSGSVAFETYFSKELFKIFEGACPLRTP